VEVLNSTEINRFLGRGGGSWIPSRSEVSELAEIDRCRFCWEASTHSAHSTFQFYGKRICRGITACLPTFGSLEYMLNIFNDS